MPKFFGKIGFASSEETAKGVWQDVVIERSYYGDVLRNTRRLEEGDKVNNDLSVGNSVSIVADAFVNHHFYQIKYIFWSGTRWLVSDVEVRAPRLILRLGGVYNGDTP